MQAVHITETLAW